MPIITEMIHSQEWMISTNITWHRMGSVGTSHDQYLGEISVFQIGLPQKGQHFYPVVSTEKKELLLEGR